MPTRRLLALAIALGAVLLLLRPGVTLLTTALPAAAASFTQQQERRAATSEPTATRVRAQPVSRAASRPGLDASALTAEAEQRQRVLAAQAQQVSAEADRLDEAAAQRQREREQAAQRAAQAAGYDAGLTDPRQIARQMAERRYGWSGSEWQCIDQLISQESSWDPRAENPSSGAYGLVQSLPAEKMASVGEDWRTNPATQLEWGFDYVRDVYGTPCAAWSFHLANNWY